MRVAIIPTGEMELRALHECLARLFPAHDFVAVPRIEARPGVKAEPFSQSFTARHDPTGIGDVPTNLTKTVQELAAQVYPRTRDAADLAVVVDDLELFNLDQPQTVIQAVHDAVRAHIRSTTLTPHEKVELAECLRARASFHLAVPMTEAWLFADPAVAARNGVPAGRSVLLRASTDPEIFETDDSAYSADDGSLCTTIADRNLRRRENRRAPWLIAPQPGLPWFTRERHPKAYLQWLCRDPKENWCTRWRESEAGAEALRQLDWEAVLANPSQCTFVRALVQDLADGLGEPEPFAVGGEIARSTARKRKTPSTVLRNL